MRRLLYPFVLLLPLLGLGAVSAGAQATVTDTVTTIVEEIEQSGRFVPPSAEPLAADVDDAINRANAAGIAVVFPDPRTDPDAIEPLSQEIDTEMVVNQSSYSGVFVLTPMVLAAQSNVGETELNRALDAAFAGSGDADTIDRFVETLTDPGSSLPAPSANDGNTGTTTTDSGGGLGGWLWGILAAALAFFGIRFFAKRRKRKAAVQAAIEVDRQEIVEQLRNNADRVIELGDPVIASKNAELIALYEEASATYQAVSIALPKATTGAEIDTLDDRIDQAEWQFEVITARLAGEPEPPSPAERELVANPPRPRGPALGPNDSVFGNGPGSGPADSRLPPPARQQQQPRFPQPRRRSGGGFLGSILGSMLGSSMSRQTSRRTQRRTSSGSWTSSSSSSSRGGGFSDPFSRSRRSSSGRSRSGGSRSRSSSRSRSGGSRGRSGGSRRR